MSVVTTMSVPVSGSDANLALVKLQNRLGQSIPMIGSSPFYTIQANYTGSTIDRFDVAFDAATPSEMISAVFRAMVNVISRTDSGFMGAPSFSPVYPTGGQSYVYNV